MNARGQLGALTERNFRALFASTTVSAVGDGVATVALAFAVLQISSSPGALGAVIAARLVAEAAVTLAAGVLADRLPRHLVLVAASAVMGAAQAATAALVLSGHASVPVVVAVQVVYGLASGFVIPAENGLVPLVVSPVRLQQANALLGLTRSIVRIGGPALGGLLVAAGSPGGALAVDAASFALAALFLARVAIPPRADTVVPEPFLRELREGWDEFSRRTWLWVSVVCSGLANMPYMAFFVLGPLVAKSEYDGAPTWAALSSALGVGMVAGGLVALRMRPSRPLLVASVAALPMAAQPVALALRAPVPVLLAVCAVAGAALSVHFAFWSTVFMRQIPEHARSRVSSYDAFGSFVLTPVGAALAGPVAQVVGVRATLAAAGIVTAALYAVVLLIPTVWTMGDVGAEAAVA